MDSSGGICNLDDQLFAGWYGAASLLGGYGGPATGSKAGPAASAALKTWAVAIPVSPHQLLFW